MANHNSEYSLINTCKTCSPKCCEVGAPLVTPDEVKTISQATGISPFLPKEEQYIIDSEPCPFLNGNLCSIQQWKPAVCLAWPINMCLDKSSALRFVVMLEDSCPAHKLLPPSFLSAAVRLLSTLNPTFLRTTAGLTRGYDFRYMLLSDYLEQRNLAEMKDDILELEKQMQIDAVA